MKLGRIIRYKIFWLIAFCILTLYLVIQRTPLVPEKPPITGAVAQAASDKGRDLAHALSEASTAIDLTFTEQDVLAISMVASHLFTHTNFAFGYHPSFLEMGTTTQLPLGLGNIYLNTSCKLALSSTESYIDMCRLGDLPVPGWLLKLFLNAGVWLMFDAQVNQSVNNILAGLRYNDRTLILSAQKSADLMARLNASVSNQSSVVNMALSKDIPPADIIEIYLDTLYQTDFNSKSLLLPIKQLAQLASVRSLEHSPSQENAAMIWALAIRFGSQQFAKLANVVGSQTDLGVVIRQRNDLALHFLYSAVLEQISDENTSFNIGELKEVLDSGAGGSGFSFVDLAADKAGIAFAKALTASDEHAIRTQDQLANARSERVFFPFSHDLVEGFSESEFARIFESVNSSQYKALDADIAARIASLALYQDTPPPVAASFPSVPAISNGSWLKIDTHIHTKFSDGKFRVDDIAQKAAGFGCDAIAITDHGDRNLTAVLSADYFDDIALANGRYKNMSIIPGFEWNIPPFNGREHLTVLFPETLGSNTALSLFRQQFDHYNEKAERHLSIQPALQWLNEYAQRSQTKPVLIYNHPSRKDSSVDENLFDLASWIQHSDLVIGLSGAPGHQAKRGDDNGSYNGYLRTQHGWDPVTSVIGGVWDQLLRDGYRVLGARAPSDFHNDKMDYWPCQFSSTHVYARSNSGNDIIEALRAGNTWAQQGNFVESVEFALLSSAGKTYPGSQFVNNTDGALSVLVNIRLNSTDWQGFDTSLDELNAVIIDDNGVRAIPLIAKLQNNQGLLSLNLPLENSPSIRAIRLQGRSIQPERHDYQFMTNPIFFAEK